MGASAETAGVDESVDGAEVESEAGAEVDESTLVASLEVVVDELEVVEELAVVSLDVVDEPVVLASPVVLDELVVVVSPEVVEVSLDVVEEFEDVDVSGVLGGGVASSASALIGKTSRSSSESKTTADKIASFLLPFI